MSAANTTARDALRGILPADLIADDLLWDADGRAMLHHRMLPDGRVDSVTWARCCFVLDTIAYLRRLAAPAPGAISDLQRSLWRADLAAFSGKVAALHLSS